MTLRPGEKSLTPTGNPNNYYTKAEVDTKLAGKANVATTLAGYGITDGANTALSNLDSDGQMIVDSQNGTISNCILEIPQKIKIELSGNDITIKSGSELVFGGTVYTTLTLTEDKTGRISSSLADGLYFVNGNAVGTPILTLISKFGSGASLPADNTNYNRFYLTTDSTFYYYSNNAWGGSGITYPVCIVKMESGVASIAKDSNGNDMIFNGMGFVGKHCFVYPNVKCLFAAGKDSNDKLLSNIVITNGLLISGNTSQDRTVFYLFGPTSANAINPNAYYYSEAENLWRRNNDNTVMTVCVLANTSGNVDSMTIRQPYQGARNLLTDDLNKQIGDVETLLATV